MKKKITDIGSMKEWVGFGATQWFLIRDSWVDNSVP